MIPHLSPNDTKMYYKYLNKCTNYFEFGSGGSTYQASIRNNIKKIYSVESDIEWQKILKQKVKNNKIQYIFNEMDTKPKNWGNPGKNATNQQKINYSEQIKNIPKSEQEQLDLVFIDGRFRVACCLKSFQVIKDNCLVIFDDFLDRKHYHVVLKYFDIIEKTTDNRMVVLKKKNNITIPNNLIKKYELIHG